MTHTLLAFVVGFAAQLMVLGASDAQASAAPTVACEAAKLKAAGKDTRAQLACYVKATKKGLLVDGACLNRASAALTSSFQKAEENGGCNTTGDSGTINASVGEFV